MDYPNDRDVLETFECTRAVKFRSVSYFHQTIFIPNLIVPEQLPVWTYQSNPPRFTELDENVSKDRRAGPAELAIPHAIPQTQGRWG